MNLFGIYILVFAVIQASSGANNKLYVTYTSPDIDPKRTQGYFELPRSLYSPLPNDGNWSIAEDRLVNDGVAIACRNNDYRLCLIVDRLLSIAGLQLSISVRDMHRLNAPVSPDLGRKYVLGTEVYFNDIMFVEDEVLKSGGREMNESTETAPNGIYIKTKGIQRNLPLNEEDMARNEYFVKQPCLHGMGTHYNYNLSSASDCESIQIYAGLYNDKHNLVGCSVMNYGNSSQQEGGRPWFEYFSRAALAYTPAAPACLGDYMDKYGDYSLHLWITEEPWNIKCPSSPSNSGSTTSGNSTASGVSEMAEVMLGGALLADLAEKNILLQKALAIALAKGKLKLAGLEEETP